MADTKSNYEDIIKQMMEGHKRVLLLCIDALGPDKDQETRNLMIKLLERAAHAGK